MWIDMTQLLLWTLSSNFSGILNYTLALNVFKRIKTYSNVFFCIKLRIIKELRFMGKAHISKFFGIMVPSHPWFTQPLCVLNASDSICIWVWVWMAEWPVYGQIAIWLFRNFCAFFYWKRPNGNLARHFKMKNIYIFECDWLNGNLNDLCIAKLPFSHSHSKSNTNGNWGIQNVPTIVIIRTDCSVIGCTELSWLIHTCHRSNHSDYNARNGSYNCRCNGNSCVNHRCDWTLIRNFM